MLYFIAQIKPLLSHLEFVILGLCSVYRLFTENIVTNNDVI